jgi:uncharacterized membrane protein
LLLKYKFPFGTTMRSQSSYQSYLLAYFAALITLIVADYFWLGTLMADFYKSHLGAVLLVQPRLGPALGFYLMYIAGLLFFAVSQGVAKNSIMSSAVRSALFGIVAYGTYDLSNWATLTMWTPDITLADMTWGAFVSAISGVAAHLVLAPSSQTESS